MKTDLLYAKADLLYALEQAEGHLKVAAKIVYTVPGKMLLWEMLVDMAAAMVMVARDIERDVEMSNSQSMPGS